MRDPSKGGPVVRSMLRSKRTALIVVVAAIALFTTACFADSAPGNPPNAYVNGIFQALNRDRTGAGLRPWATARSSRTSRARGRGRWGPTTGSAIRTSARS